jgi:hypothetical protein
LRSPEGTRSVPLTLMLMSLMLLNGLSLGEPADAPALPNQPLSNRCR